MPIIESSFHPKFLFRNKHLSTIYPNFFKKDKNNYTRITLDTPDNDFIDLDVIFKDSKKLIIILHGLEGSSSSNYVTRIAKISSQNNFDVIVLNHRGCSGKTNNIFGSYHSGKTDDLDLIIRTYEKNYDEINLVGYSLGGNVTLKYLGESVSNISSKVNKAAAISVPIDLKGCSIELRKRKNKIYMERFMSSLRVKAIDKIIRFPGSGISISSIQKSKNFFDYDDLYTAPAHGFNDAEDYWEQNSSKQFLNDIEIPTLILSAQDDPFLSESCFPFS